MFEIARVLDCRGRRLVLDRPRIVGIVNVTPDSFSDGGEHASIEAAIAHGVALVGEGADALDIGGESTRPGATPVDESEELARVVPVIEALARRVAVPICVDTSKPAVMRAAVAAGAGMINDVRALRADGAIDAAAELAVPVCLMHMQGEPATMQGSPHYDDVVEDVRRFLADRVLACEFAGIPRDRLVLDPGFGFGKLATHNWTLLAALPRLAELGLPILVGLSRKRMIGEATGRERTAERVLGSAVAAVLAVERGANLVRVHDVAATREALAVLAELRGATPSERPREDREAARIARLLAGD
jgi:dihydropteroate synthase